MDALTPKAPEEPRGDPERRGAQGWRRRRGRLIPSIVFDASAGLSLVRDETGADAVAECVGPAAVSDVILRQAANDLMMSDLGAVVRRAGVHRRPRVAARRDRGARRSSGCGRATDQPCGARTEPRDHAHRGHVRGRCVEPVAIRGGQATGYCADQPLDSPCESPPQRGAAQHVRLCAPPSDSVRARAGVPPVSARRVGPGWRRAALRCGRGRERGHLMLPKERDGTVAGRHER